MDAGTRGPTSGVSVLFQRNVGTACKSPKPLGFSHLLTMEQKAVKISHRNVITNILQKTTYDSVPRTAKGIRTQVMLGVLPFSHIYGLVPVTHVGTFRGDEIIVLPRFELQSFLAAVARFRIEQISVVPPILIQILSRQEECRQHDLSSIRFVYTGAAPLGKEATEHLLKLYPRWKIGQGYGEMRALVHDVCLR